MSQRKYNSLGEYLRSVREQSNMTLKEVSNSIGIDISLLAKIERSERKPTKDFIRKISSLFVLDENHLKIEYLSDQIAYKILEENADITVLKIAESKIEYLKKKKKEK